MDPLLHGIDNYPGLRFKGSKPKAPSSSIADTENRKWARQTLYPDITNAMEGRGFGPTSLLNKRYSSTMEGLDESYGQAQGDLTSQLARSVRPGDTRVSNFAQNQLTRDYITAKDQLRRGFTQEKLDDQEIGLGMAADALAQEKRMSIQGAGQYNTAMTQQRAYEQQYGTFGTNLWGGIGEGAASYMFAQKMGQ